MKKFFLCIAVMLSILLTDAVAQKKWVVSEGFGIENKEYMVLGFSNITHVGYRPNSLLEIGANIHFATNSTFTDGSYKTVFNKPAGEFATTLSADVSVGVNVFDLAKLQKHNLFVCGFLGSAFSNSCILSNMGMPAPRRYGSYSYGARLNYEYQISEQFGVGVSGMIDLGHDGTSAAFAHILFYL